MSSEFGLVRVSGKDAPDFLHRLTTAHVKKLEPGTATRGLLLRGTSKVVGQFVLARLQDTDFFLVCGNGQVSALAGELEALHFSEDLEIRADGAGLASGLASGRGGIPEDFFPIESVVTSWRVATGVPGFDFFVSTVGAVSGAAGVQGERESRRLIQNFHDARVLAGVPWEGKEWTPDTNALDAGLAPWIARQKGCYPGQEVVERALSVGHPAKALVKIFVPGSAREGDELFVREARAGRITSIASVISSAVSLPTEGAALPTGLLRVPISTNGPSVTSTEIGSVERETTDPENLRPALAVVQWSLRDATEFRIAQGKGVAPCRK